MILLDTDHLTVLRFRSGERCVRLVARMEAVGNEVLGTTIVNAAEQIKGWLAAINKERDVLRQVTGYRELSRLFDFYSGYHIFDHRLTLADGEPSRLRIGSRPSICELARIATAGADQP